MERVYGVRRVYNMSAYCQKREEREELSAKMGKQKEHQECSSIPTILQKPESDPPILFYFKG